MWLKKKVKNDDLVDFWSYMSHLVSSGMPLSQSLEVVKTLTKNKFFQQVIDDLIHHIHQGQNFSDAMGSYPDVFSVTAIQLIKLAEQTATYSVIFQRLEQQEKWYQQIQQLIRQSLRYPLILLGTTSIFICVLIGVLIPNLKGYLSVVNQKQLPYMTRALIFVGDHIIELCFGFMGFLIFLWAIILLRRRLRYKPLRYFLPLLGPLLYQLQTLNFGHNLGVLLAAKVNVLASLFYAAESTTCRWLKNHLREQENLLIQGQSLSQTLPKVLGAHLALSSMLIIGERSGNMADLLIKSTAFELEQTQGKLKAILELLQPFMVVVMGILLAWSILAILIPLYDSLSLAGGMDG